jgi:hypothetical protein
MSGKFLWDGIDINEIIDTTTSTNKDSSVITNSFNFGGGAGGNFLHEVNITNPTTSNLDTYFCYHPDEFDEIIAPPYTIDNENIFTKEYSDNPTTTTKRVLVKSFSLSNGSSNFNLPTWCSAIKIYFYSRKGSQGNSGNPISISSQNTGHNDTNNRNAQHVNHHKNYNNIFEKRRHNDDYNQITYTKHNTHTAHGSASAPGGPGGAGGAGKLGWYYKYMTFTPGQNNNIEYSISTSDGGTNYIKLKNPTTELFNMQFRNGFKGAAGGHSYVSNGVHNANKDADPGRTLQKTNTNNTANNKYVPAMPSPHQWNFKGNVQGGDHRYTVHAVNFQHTQNTVQQGTTGATGTAGDITSIISTLSNQGQYLTYNSNENDNQIIIYCFKT